MSHVLYGLRLGVLVIDGERELETWLARALPEVLPVVAGLGMVEFTEASESEELFARRCGIFLVNRGQEALDLGALVAYYKATKTELGNVLVRHVQLVYILSAMWCKLLTSLHVLFSLEVFTNKFLHHTIFCCLTFQLVF